MTKGWGRFFIHALVVQFFFAPLVAMASVDVASPVNTPSGGFNFLVIASEPQTAGGAVDLTFSFRRKSLLGASSNQKYIIDFTTTPPPADDASIRDWCQASRSAIWRPFLPNINDSLFNNTQVIDVKSHATLTQPTYFRLRGADTSVNPNASYTPLSCISTPTSGDDGPLDDVPDEDGGDGGTGGDGAVTPGTTPVTAGVGSLENCNAYIALTTSRVPLESLSISRWVVCQIFNLIKISATYLEKIFEVLG